MFKTKQHVNTAIFKNNCIVYCITLRKSSTEEDVMYKKDKR